MAELKGAMRFVVPKKVPAPISVIPWPQKVAVTGAAPVPSGLDLRPEGDDAVSGPFGRRERADIPRVDPLDLADLQPHDWQESDRLRAAQPLVAAGGERLL